MSIVSIKIEAAEGSPFRIGTQYGRTYVGGEIGQRYKLVVANSSYKRVAVVVTVDGKNVLDGKPGDPAGQAMIIGSNQTYAFDGWRTSMEEVAAFRLVDAGESYAAKTGDGSNVGVVGVAVFEEHRAPLGYLGGDVTRGGAMRGGGGMSIGTSAPTPARAAAGTGFGERLESHVGTTRFDRATEEPAEIHVCYYDTVGNLIARGVLPADAGPNPFPAKPPAPAFCAAPE
jgi:hypothetical protein